jgi:hypothetical protein
MPRTVGAADAILAGLTCRLCGSAGVDVQPAGVQVSTTWVATDDTKPSSKSVRWCLVPSAENDILAGNGPCYGVPAQGGMSMCLHIITADNV